MNVLHTIETVKIRSTFTKLPENGKATKNKIELVKNEKKIFLMEAVMDGSWALGQVQLSYAQVFQKEKK
jgi:hypothetical protein